MRTVYDALGGEAAVTELAVLTSLWVAEWPALGDSVGDGCVLTDDSLLVSYWSHVLGGPLDQQPYDGPLYLFTSAGQDLDLCKWMLDELMTAANAMQVRASTPHAWAAFMALVRWDVAETLDHSSPEPLLPARNGLPSWGWTGPQDAESLTRQDVLHDRLRDTVLGALRPTDPVSTRLEWQTSAHRWFVPDGADRVVTELVLVVQADEPGEPSFTWPVTGAPRADRYAMDQMVDDLQSWVSTDTRFGWGQERP